MGFIFKPIHLVLGKLILFIDWITRPRPVQRSAEEQQKIDSETRHMALYHYPMCPFCVGTRRQMYRLGLNIDLRDPRNDDQWMAELVEQGGKKQVPCLRIEKEDGSVEMMYESEDIKDYLARKYG
jgi:glutaredoxin